VVRTGSVTHEAISPWLRPSVRLAISWRRHSRTHSLRLLVDLLPRAIRIHPVLESVVGLTDYAVTARYPGETEPVDQAELEESIRLAQAVVRWAESQVRGSLPIT
jgi:HEPN domain-containing protein